MLCPKYQQLTPTERVTFIGSLVHAVQSDDYFFEIAKNIQHLATLRGLFDNVVINPTSETSEAVRVTIHDEIQTTSHRQTLTTP
jgi:hypothetical protein